MNNHLPTRIVIFAKAPQPGLAKTRLVPKLGAEGAAALARHMLADTLQRALATPADAVELCMSPAPDDAAWQDITIPQGVIRTFQGGGDLGERMGRAVQRLTNQDLLQDSVPQPVHDALLPAGQPPAHVPQAAILIGTDCPALTPQHMAEAMAQLQTYDAVMLPASDGGYVLLGLKAPCPGIFTHMPWSTSTVGAETLQRLAALQLRCWTGSVLHDIDEPDDLAHLPASFLHQLSAPSPALFSPLSPSSPSPQSHNAICR